VFKNLIILFSLLLFFCVPVHVKRNDEYYRFVNACVYFKNNFLLYFEKLTGLDVYYPYDSDSKKGGKK